MYSGAIAGTGPRYCPSIEDKVVKFAHKAQHQIFWNLKDLTMILSIQMAYPPLYRHQSRDFFTAYPRPCQGGYGQAGYAIEYDFVDPRSLKSSLETHKIKGLYLAGKLTVPQAMRKRQRHYRRDQCLWNSQWC